VLIPESWKIQPFFNRRGKKYKYQFQILKTAAERFEPINRKSIIFNSLNDLAE
jgi:hypothetical protein